MNWTEKRFLHIREVLGEDPRDYIRRKKTEGQTLDEISLDLSRLASMFINEAMLQYYLSNKFTKIYGAPQEPVLVQCAICGRPFHGKPGQIIKYCGPKCRRSAANESAKKIRLQQNESALLSLRWKILNRDGFRCHYCGRAPHKDPEVVLHVDHIIPRDKGGTDHPDNLITSCMECNLGKGTRDILLDKHKEIRKNAKKRFDCTIIPNYDLTVEGGSTIGKS